MTARNPTAEKFVADEITKALERARLPYDHAIRTVLNAEAEIEGVREASVRCRGKSLDERIEDLRRDPSYAAIFPQPVGRVGRSDIRELTKNFDAIVSGAAVVE